MAKCKCGTDKTAETCYVYSNGRLSFYCKNCVRENSKRSFQKNKHKTYPYAKNLKAKRVFLAIEFVNNIKIKYGCCFCNGAAYEPECLDCHHLNPKEKDNNISNYVQSGSTEKLLNELKKCIVVCANCHRKVHSGKLIPNEKDLIKLDELDLTFRQNVNGYRKRKIRVPKQAIRKIDGKYTKVPFDTPKQTHIRKTKINWPNRDELNLLVWEKPTSIIAKNLGVTDKAVEKRCKKYGINKPPRGYWTKRK